MLTETQAQAGLEYLHELRDRNNYWGAMWVPQIERLTDEGKPLVEVITGCLDVAAKWFNQAGQAKLGRGFGSHGGAYPTGVDGDLGDSLWRLFETTGQSWNWAKYGYGKGEPGLASEAREPGEELPFTSRKETLGQQASE